MECHNIGDVMYLLSNITHQIINPLNGVIGTLDNIIDGTVTRDKAPQKLRSARGQLECTVSLIRNLAFFAQYSSEYGKKVSSKMDKTCIIPQVIIEAAQFFQEQGHLDNIRIELENRQVQNAIKGNPDLLRQVFMNIFDNGIKYSYPNTIIEAKNWIQKKTGHLIIQISSNSVPFQSKEDIFGLGIRGKGAEERTSSGSGLGLHICKLIIENVFGGSISAEYHTESNTAVFEIRIPDAFLQERLA
ncbi:MAG: HAMP domain-containing sensor histidine kinase [Syntrophobacteraceae bacterium]